MAESTFPPAVPHGTLEELFDDVFFVQGAAPMPGPVPVSGSRNMVVVRDGSTLTLFNTLRLDDAGLTRLEALGEVKHIVRVAGFHGRDDAFYKERYDATVYAVEGMRYAKGFDMEHGEAYFEPDVFLSDGDDLPTAGTLHRFSSCRVAEGIAILDREGGIAITGDALQNWDHADRFFNLPAKLAFRLFGFIREHNVGPGWLRYAAPSADDVRGILDLPFEHVLPAHGTPVIGDARDKYRPAIERAAAARS